MCPRVLIFFCQGVLRECAPHHNSLRITIVIVKGSCPTPESPAKKDVCKELCIKHATLHNICRRNVLCRRESKGCLIKGCLNSTGIRKVGVPVEFRDSEVRDSEGRENPHWDSARDRDFQSQGFRSQGFRRQGLRKQGFRSCGFRKWPDSGAPYVLTKNIGVINFRGWDRS